MRRWSTEAKENAAARREYRIGEAADAVADVLKQAGCLCKRDLFRLAGHRAQLNRQTPSGVVNLPTIANKAVKVPDEKFISSNWQGVRDECAKDNHYIVWDRGRGVGVRLGTLEEYEANQEILRSAARGDTDAHNDRAEVIRHAGLITPDLAPPLLLDAPDE